MLKAINKDSPSPNTYDVGTTIGKATSVIIASRKDEQEKDKSKIRILNNLFFNKTVIQILKKRALFSFKELLFLCENNVLNLF